MAKLKHGHFDPGQSGCQRESVASGRGRTARNGLRRRHWETGSRCY